MKITDLSQTFCIDDMVFPGTERMSFYRTQTIEKDSYNLSMITINSHAGTHTDAPFHFVANGKTLGDVAIEKFVGPCFVANCMDKNANSIIDICDVEKYEKQIKKAKRIIFATGWGKNFNTDDFFTCYPSISNDLAKWLVNLGVEMVGVEAPSLNTATGEETHHIFLEKEVEVVETLTNLEGLLEKEVLFCGVPLKFVGMDGFPIRAYAIEM